MQDPFVGDCPGEVKVNGSYSPTSSQVRDLLPSSALNLELDKVEDDNGLDLLQVHPIPVHASTPKRFKGSDFNPTKQLVPSMEIHSDQETEGFGSCNKISVVLNRYSAELKLSWISIIFCMTNNYI